MRVSELSTTVKMDVPGVSCQSSDHSAELVDLSFKKKEAKRRGCLDFKLINTNRVCGCRARGNSKGSQH